jgi:crossover junction endodeoxyribonuclease RuvC
VFERILMGVDPGLTITGWGVVRARGRKVTYIESGKIRSKAGLPMGERLKRIYDELQDVAQRCAVDAGAVESGYVGKSAQSGLKLGQARAAAVLAMETLGISVADVSPREVKLAVTGRGGAAKEQVGYMVGQLLGLEFDKGEEDISDALAIAMTLALSQTMRPQPAAMS